MYTIKVQQAAALRFSLDLQKVFFTTTCGLNYTPHTHPYYSTATTTSKYINHPFITIPPLSRTILSSTQASFANLQSCGAKRGI